MKDIMTILHFLFVSALYVGSAINLFVGVSNRDTYNLVMATILYIIASKYGKSALKESEDNNGIT